MKTEIDLYELAFASYVYTSITGYDVTYRNLLENTGGSLNLDSKEHRAFLIKWLNSWGCRQFAIEYHELASSSILNWFTRWKSRLVEEQRTLIDTTVDRIEEISHAYKALSQTIASHREGNIQVHIGPTGSAKLLFALRPAVLPPWDDPIRKELGYNGGRESYKRFLIHTQTQLLRLQDQCLKKGFDIGRLPKELNRPDVTLPKLIDEYYWVVITRRIVPPNKQTLKRWYELSK